ncbi:MAG: succinate dehydrogenase iron-sulfur subunit [Candidatus Brocadiia bacterium]
MNSSVTFKVFRFDPAKDKDCRFDSFTVPFEKGLTVLEGLYYIMENLDGTLAFRSSCRAAVCGSCAMHVNGKYRLSCKTQVEALNSDTITVRPVAHLPIHKDLVVDMGRFFKHYESIKPYLMPSTAMPEKEFPQSPEERKKIDNFIDCILCGACYGSCPVAGSNPDYIGPHSILRAARWINDSRDTIQTERLNVVADNLGVWRCHSIFNCQAACPKDLDPAGAITQLKRKALWHKVKRIFGG